MFALEALAGPCDHAHQAKGHDPGRLLRHLTGILNGTCTFPPCRQPEHQMDNALVKARYSRHSWRHLRRQINALADGGSGSFARAAPAETGTAPILERARDGGAPGNPRFTGLEITGGSRSGG